MEIKLYVTDNDVEAAVWIDDVHLTLGRGGSMVLTHGEKEAYLMEKDVASMLKRLSGVASLDPAAFRPTPLEALIELFMITPGWALEDDLLPPEMRAARLAIFRATGRRIGLDGEPV